MRCAIWYDLDYVNTVSLCAKYGNFFTKFIEVSIVLLTLSLCRKESTSREFLKKMSYVASQLD